MWKNIDTKNYNLITTFSSGVNKNNEINQNSFALFGQFIIENHPKFNQNKNERKQRKRETQELIRQMEERKNRIIRQQEIRDNQELKRREKEGVINI